MSMMQFPLRPIATLAAFAWLASLPACTTINPYTRETQMSKGAIGAATGAVVGAGLGAAIGALTGDNGRERKKRALIGAGAGAGVGVITGGAVGVYMDQQEAELRERLERSGVSVTRIGNDIILNMPGNVTFETDSADLRPQFFEVLSSVGLVVQKYGKTLIEVSGHTDSTGSDQYNLELSGRRASTVANYLASQGVMAQRFNTLAFGETKPIASNATAAGREQNRRVEIVLVPLTAS